MNSRILNLLNSYLKNRPALQIILVSLVLAVLVAMLDYSTGYELSVAIYYLFPIALSSWYAGRVSGLFLSIVSALCWLVVDHTSGHHYSHNIIPLWNATVRFGFFVVTAQLITALRIRLKTEKDMARTDDLTGIMNGRAFREAVQTVLRVAARHGRPAVLGYIDVDDFKRVNDELGHAEGDRVLRAVAATLQGFLRGTDLVGRLGGDEFVVFLPETTVSGANAAFRRILHRLRAEAKDHKWPIGFSIGVAVFKVPPRPWTKRSGLLMPLCTA